MLLNTEMVEKLVYYQLEDDMAQSYKDKDMKII